VRLGPGLGIGASWLRARASHEEHDADVASVAPVAEGRATLTVPMGRGFGIDLGVGFALSPTAAAGPVEEDDFTLPGRPRAGLRAGIGLRWGGP
jgi:hypothetical protein